MRRTEHTALALGVLLLSGCWHLQRFEESLENVFSRIGHSYEVRGSEARVREFEAALIEMAVWEGLKWEWLDPEGFDWEGAEQPPGCRVLYLSGTFGPGEEPVASDPARRSGEFEGEPDELAELVLREGQSLCQGAGHPRFGVLCMQSEGGLVVITAAARVIDAGRGEVRYFVDFGGTD